MPTPLVSSTDQRLARLTQLLAEWQPLWRPAPFMYRQLPWQLDDTRWVESLLALSDAEVERLEADPWQASPLEGWLPVGELEQLLCLAPLDATTQVLPPAWGQHVGGRKWQQIEAFIQHLQVAPHDELMEWCAGKGHLARALARHHGVEVTALEWQTTLCQEGQQLAARQRAWVTLHEQDVLAGGVERFLSPQTHVVALHACGDLHLRLLDLAAESGSAVTLAPCCYQRTRDEPYRPVSQLARRLCQSHSLVLERDDLALAVQESVTAPRGVRRRREQANAWRLGFDELQRNLRGEDRYLPVPSLAYGRLPPDFEAFCRWAASQKGLTLPARLPFSRYELEGWRRQARVKRLELVRHLFRRPLEIWLVLDRVARMEEAGFTVQFGSFCASRLTPRNLYLHARKNPGSR